eukprot:GHVP01027813.1.p1 GENE.GHVP01027813.1~~GHVP01027813.1.p1  ORF type:complete len:634 (-),score=120.15 GHVP01027813.1:856-2757(-)
MEGANDIDVLFIDETNTTNKIETSINIDKINNKIEDILKRKEILSKPSLSFSSELISEEMSSFLIKEGVIAEEKAKQCLQKKYHLKDKLEEVFSDIQILYKRKERIKGIMDIQSKWDLFQRTINELSNPDLSKIELLLPILSLGEELKKKMEKYSAVECVIDSITKYERIKERVGGGAVRELQRKLETGTLTEQTKFLSEVIEATNQKEDGMVIIAENLLDREERLFLPMEYIKVDDITGLFKWFTRGVYPKIKELGQIIPESWDLEAYVIREYGFKTKRIIEKGLLNIDMFVSEFEIAFEHTRKFEEHIGCSAGTISKAFEIKIADIIERERDDLIKKMQERESATEYKIKGHAKNLILAIEKQMKKYYFMSKENKRKYFSMVEDVLSIYIQNICNLLVYEEIFIGLNTLVYILKMGRRIEEQVNAHENEIKFSGLEKVGESVGGNMIRAFSEVFYKEISIISSSKVKREYTHKGKRPPGIASYVKEYINITKTCMDKIDEEVSEVFLYEKVLKSLFRCIFRRLECIIWKLENIGPEMAEKILLDFKTIVDLSLVKNKEQRNHLRDTIQEEFQAEKILKTILIPVDDAELFVFSIVQIFQCKDKEMIKRILELRGVEKTKEKEILTLLIQNV